MKKFTINADDFGLSKERNEAILQGVLSGVINSTSVIVNMPAFDNAINTILPKMPNINLGFHFNIMEGKSLTNSELLTDKNGYFKNSYLQLILKSYNQNFLNALEIEFRAQIEKILEFYPVTNLDSHVHIHAIPNIFKLFLRLAKEYNIKYIRTQNEIPYLVSSSLLNYKFYINILKNILLKYFTYINKQQLKHTDLLTNDYFVGILYSGFMSETTIKNGLLKIKGKDNFTEVIFHPSTKENTANYKEFLITKNFSLKEFANKYKFIQCCFKDLFDKRF